MTLELVDEQLRPRTSAGHLRSVVVEVGWQLCRYMIDDTTRFGAYVMTLLKDIKR